MSSNLSKLGIEPCHSERKVIEQMYGTVDKRVEIYKVCVEYNALDNFGIELQCINAEKPVLTYLPNSHIRELKRNNHRITRLRFSEETSKEDQLPVRIILRATDIQRIKSTEPQCLE